MMKHSCLTAALLAQLGERRYAEREVESSLKSRRDRDLGSLNNREESFAFVMTCAKG